MCPSSDAYQSEIPAHDYDVVVFENRFPSFALSSVMEDPEDSEDGDDGFGSYRDGSGTAGHGLFATAPGFGRCEVVCFTSDHDAAFSSLTPARVRTVIDAWVDRTTELSLIPGSSRSSASKTAVKRSGSR